MIDGDPVLVGDMLWDIVLRRFGTVVSITGAGDMQLDFDQPQLARYGTGGMFGGVQRLYWRNPVITAPRKVDPQWPLIQAVVATIRANP